MYGTNKLQTSKFNYEGKLYSEYVDYNRYPTILGNEGDTKCSNNMDLSKYLKRLQVVRLRMKYFSRNS